MQLSEGIIIAEHYKLLKQLGQGSFGDVWLAHNLLADIDVAIKFYGTLDQNGIEEFRNEFKIAYRLHHPNLLNINHFDVFDNCPYLVMPYCENGSVSRQVGQMPEHEIWKFVHDVSGGLAFLHSQQPSVVHQDIKPDNILITSEGRYVISDFGISRSFRTKMSRTNNVSSSGTIAYMGPERFSEKPMVVLASDIWAFGMTLYELMTGQVLWEGMGGCVQLNGARIPLIGGSFSNELTQLVTACLAVETWNRPTAAQIHDYASAYIQGKRLPPIGPTEPKPNPVRTGNGTTAPYPPRTITTQPQKSGAEKVNYHIASKLKDGVTSKQTLKRGLIAAAALVAAIALISGVVSFISSISEEHAFVSCTTKQDYEQFIKDYPSSSYKEIAQKRIASMTPPEPATQQENTPLQTAVPKSKEEQPQTLYIKERQTSEKPRQKVLQPTSSATQNVSVRNSMTEDDRAFYNCISTKDYHTYLTNFPNGRHRKEAEQQLTSLLNQTNGNEINLNSNAVPSNQVRHDMPRNGGSVMQQRSVGIQVGTGSFRSGVQRGGGGGSRGGRSGQRSSGGGSSHRHSN